MTETNTYCFTPPIRVTMAFLHKTDARKKLPNGKVVGNDKFKLRGFFDPKDAATRVMLDACVAALTAAGVKQDQVNAAILASFPLATECKNTPEAIPAGWRRLTASTQFGPVECIDRQARAVAEAQFFPGVWAIAYVSPFAYDDERTGQPRVSLRLATVLLDKADARLGGGRPDAKAVFSGLVTQTTDVDPFGGNDEVPF